MLASYSEEPEDNHGIANGIGKFILKIRSRKTINITFKLMIRLYAIRG